MIRKLGVNLFLLWQHFILKRQNIFHSELCACCVAIASSVISKHDSNKTLNGTKTVLKILSSTETSQ